MLLRHHKSEKMSIYSATIMYLIHARVVHILGASLSAGEEIDNYNHNCLPSCKTIALHTRSRIHGMINIINTAITLYPKLSTSTCSTLLELLAEKTRAQNKNYSQTYILYTFAIKTSVYYSKRITAIQLVSHRYRYSSCTAMSWSIILIKGDVRELHLFLKRGSVCGAGSELL